MKRILLIDDDDSLRKLLKMALEDEGYEVIAAAEGLQGAALYHQHPCDLVITDIYMPEKDGLESILEFKKTKPEQKIIAMSGGGLHWDADYALSIAKQCGADHVCEKPFPLPKLLNIIAAMLQADAA
ncbi:response regulator [Deltaproteobacteria bacterium TL4]